MTQPLDLDLDAAMKSVMREAYRDEVPDVIRNVDFPPAWSGEKGALTASLGEGTYRPRHPYIVEVPKSALATRPIAVIPLPDRIVFEAVMSKLSAPIDAEITEEVYSSRLRRTSKGRVLRPHPIKAWTKFQRAGRQMCDRFENVCMLTTDVISYFEFIDIDLLVHDLKLLPGADELVVNQLKGLLRGFSDATNLNGVPQGPRCRRFSVTSICVRSMPLCEE